MRFLSEHFDGARRRHPDDELCVVFDIDGTILDLRHLVVHVLLASDRDRGTELFVGLVPNDITHHEDDVDRLLASLSVPEAERGTSPRSTGHTCGTGRRSWRRASRTRACSA